MFVNELKNEYRVRYGVQGEISGRYLDELKKYLRSEFVSYNKDFVTIYICDGGAVSCGFPNISTDESYTIHCSYKDSLFKWLKENGFDYTTTRLKVNDRECPPAHGGWIHQNKITKVVISGEKIKS